MAKRTPAVKKPVASNTNPLIDAIATVKQLQDFVKEYGNAEKAIATATRVYGLIQMTGGFDSLKQALEIVGKDPEPTQA
jgi:hypothetical protein